MSTTTQLPNKLWVEGYDEELKAHRCYDVNDFDRGNCHRVCLTTLAFVHRKKYCDMFKLADDISNEELTDYIKNLSNFVIEVDRYIVYLSLANEITSFTPCPHPTTNPNETPSDSTKS